MSTITFKDYHYVRPDLEKVKQKFEETIAILSDDNPKIDSVKAIDELNKVRAHFDTMSTLCSIRNSINTQDPFYETERAFFDENGPVYEGYQNELLQALVKSPHKEKLVKHLGEHLFKMVEVQLKVFKPEIIPDLQQENKLVTKYNKLKASAQIEFRGGTYNLSQMGPFLQDPDRNTRRDAEKAVADFYEQNEKAFDEIYDELVKVRAGIAKKLGFKNFVEVGYYRLSRTDYDAEMVANYRKQVYEDVVPVVKRLIAAKAKRLNIPDLKSYDLALSFLSSNPTPKGDRPWLVEQAKKMYHEMSKETGDFIDFMTSRELLDLDAKPGKESGGYCTYIPEYQSPFIFANFNGTSGDVDVLTHEAGHAFQVFSSRNIGIPDYMWPTMEAAEIHSMSMEFFAWPWMELFFKEDAKKYYYSHLADSLIFIPYGVAVDEFQHFVYENPEASPEERKAAWRKIEEKYLPYKIYEVDFLNRGGYWFRQGHIFQVPFYYIDYTLAQVCAHQFWIKDHQNHEKAWQDYYRLCCAGGSDSFLNLLKIGNLLNPFEDGTVKKIVSVLDQWLAEYEQKVKFE